MHSHAYGEAHPLRLFSQRTFRFGVCTYCTGACSYLQFAIMSNLHCRWLYLYYLIPPIKSTHFNQHTACHIWSYIHVALYTVNECVVCVCANFAAAPSFTRLFGNASSIGNAAVESADGPFGVNGRYCWKGLFVVIKCTTIKGGLAKKKKIVIITSTS